MTMYRGNFVVNKVDPYGMKTRHPGNCKLPKKCVLKYGPKYFLNRDVHWSGKGFFDPQTFLRKFQKTRKSVKFSLSAGFDWNTGSCECCEVRQYIEWDLDYQMFIRQPFWDQALAGQDWPLSPYSCYEDRDSVDGRYGYRSDTGSNANPRDEYVGRFNERNQKTGCWYKGDDYPTVGPSAVGKWKFKLVVIDRCNGDKVVGTDTLTVDWSKLLPAGHTPRPLPPWPTVPDVLPGAHVARN